MPSVPVGYSHFILVESCSQLFPISVSARSIQPHFGCVSVRERGIWGTGRGWGKYCTALQYCGYSVETRANFGGFIELFTKKKKEDEEIKI